MYLICFSATVYFPLFRVARILWGALVQSQNEEDISTHSPLRGTQVSFNETIVKLIEVLSANCI